MALPNETGAEGLTPEQTKNWKRLLRVLLIVLAGFWIYQPALHGGWLWDDYVDIVQNTVTRSPTGLWNIWFEPGSQLDYYPVKASVQWVQWHLWGDHTLGYHLTNLVLHLTGALLVWWFLGKFRLKLAWLGGLIFAVHPVQVESVAWITEIKNTLSLPLFLLAMGFYFDYEERGRGRDYAASLGLFVVAMLVKPAMVMFPVVILLYAWWKRGRIGWKDAKASAPFFAVSLVVGLLTLLIIGWFEARYQTGLKMVPEISLVSRLALTGSSLAFYLSKVVLPVGLLPIYPQWPIAPPPLIDFLAGAVPAGLALWFWVRRRTWGRHALLGFGFFLLNLAPFCGLIPANYMQFTWVMDHFLYLPILGLIGLAVAAADEIEARLDAATRPYAVAAVAAIMIFLTVSARDYASKFTSQETLWTYTLEHNPAAWPAHNNLGSVYLVTGRVDAALEQYRLALMAEPALAYLHANFAMALMHAGRQGEALDQFHQAERLQPSAVAHARLGDVLTQMGRGSDALAEYRKALEIDPANSDAHYALGNLAAQAGRFPEAVDQYRQALRAEPGFAEAHTNLGNVYFETGQNPEAIEQYELALAIEPDNADTRCNLASALVKSGKIPEAIEQYQAALKINPDLAGAQMMLQRLKALPAANP